MRSIHSDIRCALVLSWPPADSDHILVNAEEMASIEKRMIANGMPVSSLMEKVGHAMADCLLTQPNLLADGVLVLVGPGHNGGDGLVLAKELYLSKVKVCIWTPLVIKASLTKAYLRYVKWLGVEQLGKVPDSSDNLLWVDAVFGLGQSRILPVKIATLFQERERCKPGKLVSLDVPSGICSDSGKTISEGNAVASQTITVGLFKKGLLQDIAISNVGKIKKIDIGIPAFLLSEQSKSQIKVIHPTDLSALTFPKIQQNAMKYQRGRLLTIVGSETYLGAATLAVRGAQSSGVGSIKAILPEVLGKNFWQVLPEVVVSGTFDSRDSWDKLINNCLSDKLLNRLDAILFGPGIGNIENSWSQLSETLISFKGLLVLDADGLNQIALSNEGWKWFLRRQGPTWITPHLKEFHRLFPQFSGLIPLDAALEASRSSKTFILLKGAHSVVTTPDGAGWKLFKSAPWSARSGLGDVLAGYVAGLGALGLASGKFDGGELLAKAMFLHSQAALTSREGSSASLIASSLMRLTTTIQGGECSEK